jgi:hypothetical protein
MASKSGKLRSYNSFANNAWVKLQPEMVGHSFAKKQENGSVVITEVTKELHKNHIKSMNRLQGKQSESKFIKKYLKSKGWEKVKITSKSSKKEVRKALKNQKIYQESKARLMVHEAKKKGHKMTLKHARGLASGILEKYEGVGGSW